MRPQLTIDHIVLIVHISRIYHRICGIGPFDCPLLQGGALRAMRVPLQVLRVSVKVVHIMIFALHIILLQLDHMD